MGIPNFGSFYYQRLFSEDKSYQSWSLTEHIPSIMPKYIYNSVWSAQIFIHNFFTRLFKGMNYSTAVIMIAVMTMVSFWAHTTRAEAPVPSRTETSTTETTISSLEKVVDGLTVSERAAKIDAFYIAKGDLPLAGHGRAMVEAADQYGIDWRLVAAIGFIESTGGKHACKRVSYSAFGWGSCKIDFSSYEESIDVISKNLGGHNPRTATHYQGKTLSGILDAYNPAHIRPNYKKLVTGTMDTIAQIDAPAVLAKK
jgi:hypothetical protein